MALLARYAQEAVFEHAAAQVRIEFLAHVLGQRTIFCLNARNEIRVVRLHQGVQQCALGRMPRVARCGGGDERRRKNFTAGTLLWPVIFIMTDTINEYYGQRGVRFISWLAVFLIVYGFAFAFAAIHLAPASWWVSAAQNQGVPNLQAAFSAIFGQGLWTISGSVIAFLIGQLIDVSVFHRIRRSTGEKHVWLRATGSTAVSQLVDSFVVLYIAFVIGPQHWALSLFFAVGTLNYLYKMLAAVALIPLLYLARVGIHAYLGKEQAQHLTELAARQA